MSKTTLILSENVLFAVRLPQATETYTVISHEFIVNHVRQGLEARGFSVLSSEYRANHDGEVARGVHVVQYGDDPDMKMIFSWVNSYDKSTKFQCGIGAQVTANESYILSEGMTNWIRKHTGTADTEAEKIISDQLDKAEEYFISLVDCKNKMKNVIISPIHFYHLLGRLYFTNALSTQQLSAIKSEIKNSKITYNAAAESLWVMYNHILVVLKSAHPKTWMKQQTHIHYSIMNEFDILAHQPVIEEALEELEEIDPLTENYGQPENQTNLLVQIAEVTGDGSVLEPVKAFTETLDEAIIEKAKEDTRTLEAMVWGGDIQPIDTEMLEEVEEELIDDTPEITGIPNGIAMSDTDDLDEEEELLEEIIEEEVVEVAPDRVKFAIDLDEEDLTPVEEELEEIEEDEEELLNAQYPVTPENAFVSLDEEDDVIINEVLTPISSSENIGKNETEIEEVIFPHDEIVQYQDPAGNTFEAPVVESKAPQEFIDALVNAPEMEASEVDMSKVTWVDAPETVKEVKAEELTAELEEDLEFSFNPEVETIEEEAVTEEESIQEDHEEDFHIKNVLSTELEELFGEQKDFTYKLVDDKYVITFEDQSTVELDKEYIDLLI
jgi:hypothetical protein